MICSAADGGNVTERRGLMREEFSNPQYLKEHVEGRMLHELQLNYVD